MVVMPGNINRLPRSPWNGLVLFHFQSVGIIRGRCGGTREDRYQRRSHAVKVVALCTVSVRRPDSDHPLRLVPSSPGCFMDGCLRNADEQTVATGYCDREGNGRDRVIRDMVLKLGDGPF